MKCQENHLFHPRDTVPRPRQQCYQPQENRASTKLSQRQLYYKTFPNFKMHLLLSVALTYNTLYYKAERNSGQRFSSQVLAKT